MRNITPSTDKPRRKTGYEQFNAANSALARDEGVPTIRNLGGRPSLWSQELADEICYRMAIGETLYKICMETRMPMVNTIEDWVTRDYNSFRSAFQQARHAQALYMDHIVNQLAEGDFESPMVAAIQMKAAQWRAKHLNRAVFGERTDITSDGERLQITISKDDEDLG